MFLTVNSMHLSNKNIPKQGDNHYFKKTTLTIWMRFAFLYVWMRLDK